jgi:hypothetical protein
VKRVGGGVGGSGDDAAQRGGRNKNGRRKGGDGDVDDDAGGGVPLPEATRRLAVVLNIIRGEGGGGESGSGSGQGVGGDEGGGTLNVVKCHALMRHVLAPRAPAPASAPATAPTPPPTPCFAAWDAALGRDHHTSPATSSIRI